MLDMVNILISKTIQVLPGDIIARAGIHQVVGGDIHRVGFELVVLVSISYPRIYRLQQ